MIQNGTMQSQILSQLWIGTIALDHPYSQRHLSIIQVGKLWSCHQVQGSSGGNFPCTRHWSCHLYVQQMTCFAAKYHLGNSGSIPIKPCRPPTSANFFLITANSTQWEWQIVLTTWEYLIAASPISIMHVPGWIPTVSSWKPGGTRTRE